MPRRSLLIVLALFVITRAGLAWLAAHPEDYGPFSITPDVDVVYASLAGDVVHGAYPYSERDIEYPPGALPFVLIPQLAGHDAYRGAFIALMAVVDLAGLVALLLLAAAGGSRWGVYSWLGGVVLLGPIAYLRLDLVPAVATLWALEARAGGRWAASGAWLGFGTTVKLYPLLLLPAAFVASPRRGRLLTGAAVVVAASLLPFIPFLPDVFADIFGYHSARGIQIESTWGALLLAANRFLAHDAVVVYDFSALHLRGGASPLLQTVSVLASLGALGWSLWAARRVLERDNGRLAGVMLATLALMMALGSVFSPQFVVWLLALSAATLCNRSSAARLPALLVLPAAALSQMIYPFLYAPVVYGEAEGLLALGARNTLTLAVGVAGFYCLLRAASSAPSDPSQRAPRRAAEPES